MKIAQSYLRFSNSPHFPTRLDGGELLHLHQRVLLLHENVWPCPCLPACRSLPHQDTNGISSWSTHKPTQSTTRVPGWDLSSHLAVIRGPSQAKHWPRLPLSFFLFAPDLSYTSYSYPSFHLNPFIFIFTLFFIRPQIYPIFKYQKKPIWQQNP